MENKTQRQRCEVRKEIDNIDSTLVELLDRRADLAIAIGKIKSENKLPVMDKAREKEVLLRAKGSKSRQ